VATGSIFARFGSTLEDIDSKSAPLDQTPGVLDPTLGRFGSILEDIEPNPWIGLKINYLGTKFKL